MYSKKAKKLTKSSPSIWHYVVSVKLTVKILSIFVAFSENVNFTVQIFPVLFTNVCLQLCFLEKEKRNSWNLSQFENENTFRKRTKFWKWQHLPKKNHSLRIKAHSEICFENDNIFLEKWKVINPFCVSAQNGGHS